MPRDCLATSRAWAAVTAPGNNFWTCHRSSGTRSITSATPTAASSSRHRPEGGGAPAVRGSAGASLRAASSTHSGPLASRRSATVSASRLASSSHCTSSTATSTGPSATQARSAASAASATACAVGAWSPAGRSHSATSSASRCGPGISLATSGNTSASKSDNPANDKSVSLAEASLRNSRWPAVAAASTPARHNVDLPAPASPCTASAAGEVPAASANTRTRRHTATRTMLSPSAATGPSHHENGLALTVIQAALRSRVNRAKGGTGLTWPGWEQRGSYGRFWEHSAALFCSPAYGFTCENNGVPWWVGM